MNGQRQDIPTIYHVSEYEIIIFIETGQDFSTLEIRDDLNNNLDEYVPKNLPKYEYLDCEGHGETFFELVNFDLEGVEPNTHKKQIRMGADVYSQ